mmetsp:Transcript_21657/g.58232  ORF Transcript_21657/g.58232 Transcript_21657/m.58232 type:complete len:203 (+) Transcript_21657:135-743(+)
MRTCDASSWRVRSEGGKRGPNGVGSLCSVYTGTSMSSPGARRSSCWRCAISSRSCASELSSSASPWSRCTSRRSCSSSSSSRSCSLASSSTSNPSGCTCNLARVVWKPCFTRTALSSFHRSSIRRASSRSAHSCSSRSRRVCSSSMHSEASRRLCSAPCAVSAASLSEGSLSSRWRTVSASSAILRSYSCSVSRSVCSASCS